MAQSTPAHSSSAEADNDSSVVAATPRNNPFGLLAGLAAFMVLFFFVPVPDGMQPDAIRVAAVLCLMMIWWLSEALPLAVTALVPLVIFPFIGIMDVQRAASSYGDPVVFLFLGGFMLAIAMEKWGLHKRLSLNILRMVGTRANTIIGGFMLATALLGMWVSNTATVLMMLPIGLAIVQLLVGQGQLRDHPGARNFATSMMLGLAYSASIGGMGTIIGTPTNAIFTGYMYQTYGHEITFAQWMLIAMPVVIVLLLACWVLLLTLYPNRLGRIDGVDDAIRTELEKLGPWSSGEKLVAIIFGLTAFLWIFRTPINHAFPFIRLNDAGIAILATLALFITPVSLQSGKKLLTWHEAEKLPWGVLLLFGGGLCLAVAIRNSQLAEWLGLQVQSLVDVPEFILIVIAAAVVLFVTEFMSNVATITTFLPILAALAVAFGYDPLILMFPATLAASLAFMSPVCTPPNAIVFGSGHVKIRQMAHAGLWLNLIGLLVAPALCYCMMLYVFT